MKNTREILLKSATEMFSKYGYDGVSTRDLVKKSGVNLCSVNYYFGSKQKLYEAVVDNVTVFLRDNFVSRVHQEIEKQDPPLRPRDEIKYILCRFFGFLCGEEIMKVNLELLLRELFKPSRAYERFYTVILEPFHKYISRLVAADTGRDEEDPRVILLTHSLFGQVIMFKIHKEALLRRLGIKKYTPEFVEDIQDLIRENCDAVLDKAMED